MIDTDRLFTKDFIAVTLTNFFVCLNYYTLLVCMTGFASGRFGASPGEAGFAASVFIIGALFARLACGRWIELIGRKRAALIGTGASLALSLAYFAVGGMASLTALRFLHGLTYGAAATATGTMVAGIVPERRKGEGIGYYMLSVTLAMAIGPFLAIVLSRGGSYGTVFWICSAMAGASLLCAALLSVKEVRLSGEQRAELRGLAPGSFFEPAALPISLVSAIVYFCYASVISFLTVYAAGLGLTGAASLYFVVFALAIFLSRPVTGRLFDARGENSTMYPAFLVFAAGMVLLGAARGAAALLGSAACIGFGLGVIQSSGQTIAVKAAPAHRVGLANSTFFICADLGFGIGPVVLGLCQKRAGYRGVYLAMAALAALGGCLYWLAHGRSAKMRIKR